MAETTLIGAIRQVVPNVNANATLAAYNTWLTMFGQDVADPLDNQVVNQRTVANWLMPSLDVKDRLSPVFSNQEIEMVIDVVFRTLSATKAAEDANRISAAQAQMVLDVYNLAWP